MFFFIGFAIVVGSVLGGYLPHGSAAVLFQPLEYLIILGAGIGAFVISNPKSILAASASHITRVMKGAPHSKESYLELLTMLYSLFKLIRTKGMLSVESHINEPEQSALFQNYPTFLHNHHAVEFLCDYLRLMTMGTDNPNVIEDLMNEDIETHHKEAHAVSAAIGALGDALPAFGIVAAVLGVITTMGSIDQPPAILGGLIGAALVGTFFGILASYGLVTPVAKSLENYSNADSKYFECMKAGLLAHLQGCAPAVSVEFARKTLFSHERPSFDELDEAVNTALPV